MQSTESFPNNQQFLRACFDISLAIAVGILVSILTTILAVTLGGFPLVWKSFFAALNRPFTHNGWYYNISPTLAELIPILTGSFTIAMTRTVVQRAENRKHWMLSTLLIVTTAITVASVLDLFTYGPGNFFEPLGWLPDYMSPLGLVIFCVGLFITLASGIIIVPRKRTFKILTASLIAAIASAAYGLPLLIAALSD